MLAAKKITDSIQEAYQCTGDLSATSASSLLSRAIHAMSEVSAYDEQIKELYEELLEVDSLLNDFNRELSDCRKHSTFPRKSITRPKTVSIP